MVTFPFLDMFFIIIAKDAWVVEVWQWEGEKGCILISQDGYVDWEIEVGNFFRKLQL